MDLHSANDTTTFLIKRLCELHNSNITKAMSAVRVYDGTDSLYAAIDNCAHIAVDLLINSINFDKATQMTFDQHRWYLADCLWAGLLNKEPITCTLFQWINQTGVSLTNRGLAYFIGATGLQQFSLAGQKKPVLVRSELVPLLIEFNDAVTTELELLSSNEESMEDFTGTMPISVRQGHETVMQTRQH